MAKHRKVHCAYCRRRLTEPGTGIATSATRDHVKPKAHGGKHTVPCCWQCNQLKGDMKARDWAAFMLANPNWWRVFHSRADVLAYVRALRWSHRRPMRPPAAFPVYVVPPPLCRGLPVDCSIRQIGG